MKHNTLSILAGLGGAMFVSTGVDAAYQGLSAVLHTTAITFDGPKSVYRVYALFDDPDDYLTTVAASPTIGNITIQSRNALDTGPGSNFYNPGSVTSPTAAAVGQNPSLEWDTFVTIGVSIADQAPPPFDQTGVSPGFLGPSSGNSFNTNNGGWFTNGPQEQGRAGFAGDGDLALRVMLLQLTVNSGDNVRGTAAIQWARDVPLAGTEFFLHMFQTFNSFPAPGPVAILALAGLGGARRRRRVC